MENNKSLNKWNDFQSKLTNSESIYMSLPLSFRWMFSFVSLVDVFFFIPASIWFSALQLCVVSFAPCNASAFFFNFYKCIIHCRTIFDKTRLLTWHLCKLILVHYPGRIIFLTRGSMFLNILCICMTRHKFFYITVKEKFKNIYKQLLQRYQIEIDQVFCFRLNMCTFQIKS